MAVAVPVPLLFPAEEQTEGNNYGQTTSDTQPKIHVDNLIDNVSVFIASWNMGKYIIEVKCGIL